MMMTSVSAKTKLIPVKMPTESVLKIPKGKSFVDGKSPLSKSSNYSQSPASRKSLKLKSYQTEQNKKSDTLVIKRLTFGKLYTMYEQ